MELIKAVEISYFRSIYKEKIDKLEHLNIIFGRNDSGKSNFLRALNLFFNSQTNSDQAFNFKKDLCDTRKAEAGTKQDARKFVSVKITFTTLSNWQNSLGSEFYVKKTWSVTKQEEPNIESSIRDGSRQQYLTRFLNKIGFYYIPTIKDRRIFENLLTHVYGVIANQEEIFTSLNKFAHEIQTKTSDLTDGIFSTLGMKSIIRPPSDLSDLFRSLDFETMNDYGDHYSLTIQRGDGIQVRHIPAILAFLSDRSSKDFHVWGFEEPENSLELANAIDEAESFRRYSKQHNKRCC